MNIKNFEFKARVDNLEQFENKLLALQPVFKGVDHQIDTYFNGKPPTNTILLISC